MTQNKTKIIPDITGNRDAYAFGCVSAMLSEIAISAEFIQEELRRGARAPARTYAEQTMYEQILRFKKQLDQIHEELKNGC